MEKTRLLILFGGQSAEHEVSCRSAVTVIRAVNPEKYELLLVKNPKNPLEIQALATALLTQNYGHTGIVYRHVSHVECIPQGELPWTLDGEYAPSAAQVMIDNLHQAVTLMA